jgi:hypothetical protein
MILLVAGGLEAHSPEVVYLEFDFEDHILWVEVAHGVEKPLKHFVETIKVKLNGKEIITQTLHRQGTKEALRIVYRIIDAGVGDEIEVTAICNISGKRKGTLELVSEK